MSTHNTTIIWKEKMQFKSTNPSGETLLINAGKENGGDGPGFRPKFLMLYALAGCSGLDVASLIETIDASCNFTPTKFTNRNVTNEANTNNVFVKYFHLRKYTN